MTRSLAVACLLLARSVLAAAGPLDFDTARGAREVGMGGTFRELGIGANAADGNPAAMALFSAYQIELAGGDDWKAKGWYAAGWIRDSTNQEFAGAYSFHYISNDYGGSNVGLWAHSLSLAARLGDKVAFGIGGRWFIQNSPHINAASLNVGPVRLASEVRSDIGRGPLAPIWNTGLELFLGKTFALRTGWEWRQPVEQNFFSAGFGIVVDTAGIDIGYRHGLAGAGDMIVGGLRLQLQ